MKKVTRYRWLVSGNCFGFEVHPVAICETLEDAEKYAEKCKVEYMATETHILQLEYIGG